MQLRHERAQEKRQVQSVPGMNPGLGDMCGLNMLLLRFSFYAAVFPS